MVGVRGQGRGKRRESGSTNRGGGPRVGGGPMGWNGCCWWCPNRPSGGFSIASGPDRETAQYQITQASSDSDSDNTKISHTKKKA